MRHHLQRLRLLARPFVVRQLRGPRARRMVGVSLIVALLTVAMGWWLAMGRGPLERDLRIGVGLEVHAWERWDDELVTVCFDEPCSRVPVDTLRHELLAELGEALAAYDPVAHGQFAELHERALASAHHLGSARRHADNIVPQWNWHNDMQRRRLARAIDLDFTPRLVVYASPLDWRGGIGVIGMLATGILVALGTVIAPVLTSIAVSQESHENTLVPITGTGLGGRDVALGLTLGACSPVAMIAVPQLVIAALTAMVVGNLVVVLGVLALACVCGGLLAMIGVLAGLYAGRRRGPGPVGVGMLAITSSWLLFGLGIGLDRSLGVEALGFSILCPSAALVLGTREAFFAVAGYTGASGIEFAAVALLPGVAAIVLGVIASRAAGRRVDERAVAPLGLGEAAIAAAVASVLVSCMVVAVADRGGGGQVFAALAMLAIPLMVLVLARVPAAQGDSPRDIELGPRMRELAIFVGIHLAVTTALAPGAMLDAIPGLGHGMWAIAVLGLTALRMLAAGNRWLVGTWGGFCVIGAAIMLANGAEFAARSVQLETLAVMFELGPLFGALQLIAIVAMPLVLVHGIRRGAVGN